MKRERTKKKRADPVDSDEILPEYDFSRARPNKYAARYAAGIVKETPERKAPYPPSPCKK